MMRKVIVQMIGEARDALKHHHLHDALYMVDAITKELGHADYRDAYERIDRDYTAMLEFLASGAHDPNQVHMQDSMIQHTYLLLNRIDVKSRCEEGTDLYAELIQDFLLADGRADQSFCIPILDTVLTSTAAEEMLPNLDEENPITRKMVLSGLTMSLWFYFEPKKVALLARYADSEARALLGLIMVAIKYRDTLPLFPESEELIQAVFSFPSAQRLIQRFNHFFFLTSRCEYIDEKIKKDYIPFLVEASQDEHLQQAFEQDEEQMDEFEKMMSAQQPNDPLQEKKQKMVDTAKELAKMQLDGVDVNLQMFVNGMRNDFFLRCSNWFLPFDLDHPAIHDTLFSKGQPVPILKMLLEQPTMADIDRYAMVILFRMGVPSGMRQAFMPVVHEGKPEDEAAGLTYNLPLLEGEGEMSSCLRALYRLCTKSRWKGQFDNLFSYSYNLIDNPYLQPALCSDTHELLSLAYFFSKYDSPTEANDYLEEYVRRVGATYDSLQLQAGCLMEMSRHRQALNLLMQADSLQPNDPYTIRRMLTCYSTLKEDEAQLDCLERLEHLLPDDEQVTYLTGLCLTRLKRFAEASQRFYKLEFENKNVIPAMRGVAWCAFMQHKYDTAMRYYQKLFERPGDAAWEDYLNAGHTTWMQGDVTKALQYYSEYCIRYIIEEPKAKDRLQAFDEDSETLVQHGKSMREIDIMHDIINLKC